MSCDWIVMIIYYFLMTIVKNYKFIGRSFNIKSEKDMKNLQYKCI